MEHNKEVIRKWVEALRSGEYRQGYGRLCNTDGEYCCLGVLCELGVEEGLIDKRESNVSQSIVFGGNSHILPREIIDWTGLDDDTPGACGKSLPYWNDDHRKTFSEIADLIEKEYLKEGADE